MTPKLSVIFLWHMHQPLYKDRMTGEYLLPWVRLHATKGYWDMAAAIDSCPRGRAVFNMTPSLLYQLEDIAKDSVKDRQLELSLKPADKLTKNEKVTLLTDFFMLHWGNMLEPIPRYKELLEKRGRQSNPHRLSKMTSKFTAADYRDLQALYNLAWFGFALRERDPVVKRLLAKGGGYTEEDKNVVIERQKKAVSEVIGLYRRLDREKKIELSTSPFYHPILPLLYRGRQKQGFDYKDDAVWHVETAAEYFEKLFGRRPEGFWPAEGSVSQDVIPLFSKARLKWIATDEEILMETLNEEEKRRDENFYNAFTAKEGPNKITVFFRDKNLSNLISFHYAKWGQEDAVNNVLFHIRNIRDWTKRLGGDHVLAIALDGENSWEFYPDGGKKFLEGLYTRIPEEDGVELTTFGEFLKKGPATLPLRELKAGSWINHNFNVWIGKPECNRAWEYLGKTREFLVKTAPDDRKAWEELYTAEGSDWFWWYDDDFHTDNDMTFDLLFRTRLMNVYKILQKHAPDYLKVPIRGFNKGQPQREPAAPITPVLDGKIKDYYEWQQAGLYDVGASGSSHSSSESIIKLIWFGYDSDNFYVRIEADAGFMQEPPEGSAITVDIVEPKPYTAAIPLIKGKKGLFDAPAGDLKSGPAGIPCRYAVDETVECSVAFNDIDVLPMDEVEFTVSLKKGKDVIESWPKGRYIAITVPSDESAGKGHPV